MRLFIIRHADPDYPNNTITPAGHLEARALAKRMAQVRPDKLYCSPMGRARDTARYTADALGMPIETEEWTAELADCRLDLPPWGNLIMWDVPGQVIRGKRPYPAHDTWHEMPPFTNPLFRQRIDQLHRASDAFLARHGYVRQEGVYRCIQPNRLGIAIFCHNGFGLCWLAHLLEIPLTLMFAGFFLPPTSVTTILFDERTAELAVPRCIGMGDISHLYKAGLPMQPSGIIANAE